MENNIDKDMDNEGTTCNDHHPHKQSDDEQDISPFVQILLVIVFVGVEMAVAFEFLYNILFLDFMGVPVHLLPSGEILSGFTALLLFPGIAWYSARGTNPLRRKTKMLMCSCLVFVLGFLGIAICAVWKITQPVPSGSLGPKNSTFKSNDNISDTNLRELGDGINIRNKEQRDLYTFLIQNKSKTFEELLQNTTYANGVHTEYDGGSPWRSTLFNQDRDPTVDVFTKNASNELGIDIEYRIVQDRSLSFMGFVGIISFSLLDIGYDTAMATGRLYVLECSSPKMHSRILNMVAISQSVGGCGFSVVGAVDFPGLLSSGLGLDGTAATVLLFGCFLLCVILVSFIGTILTGRFLVSRKHKMLDCEKDKSCTECETKKRNRYMFKKCNINGASQTSKLLSRPIKPDSNTNETDETSLLKANVPDTHGYLTFGTKQNYKLRQNENCYHDVSADSDHNDLDILTEANNTIAKHTATRPCENDTTDYYCDERLFKHYDKEEDSQKLVYDARSEPYTKLYHKKETDVICNTVQTNAYPIHAGGHGNNNNNPSPMNIVNNKLDSPDSNKSDCYPVMQRLSIWKNKKLVILCSSVFFTMGTSILWNIYNGSALTSGIYGGDSTAPWGSKGRQLYDKGLRMASLGFILFYLSNVVCSIICKKTVSIIGGRGQYVILHVVFIIFLVALSTFRTEELFFACAIAAGVYRPCAFGLSYTLSNEYVLEECNRKGASDEQRRKLIGQSIALIGTLMPIEYLVTAGLMGPLLGLTGDVWVPIVAAVVWTSVSLGVFMCLFCIRS